VLPGAGLGDDAGLADPLGEEGLADGVVDFVSASVGKILSFQPDGSAASELGKTLRLVDGGRTANEVAA